MDHDLIRFMETPISKTNTTAIDIYGCILYKIYHGDLDNLHAIRAVLEDTKNTSEAVMRKCYPIDPFDVLGNGTSRWYDREFMESKHSREQAMKVIGIIDHIFAEKAKAKRAAKRKTKRAAKKAAKKAVGAGAGP
jgi:hypothetical protein